MTALKGGLRLKKNRDGLSDKHQDVIFQPSLQGGSSVTRSGISRSECDAIAETHRSRFDLVALSRAFTGPVPTAGYYNSAEQAASLAIFPAQNSMVSA
jgi:hypothetical protein